VSYKNIKIIGQGKVNIGQNVSLGSDIQMIFHKPSTVTISDYCTIGNGVKFVCDGGDVSLGDWSTLHDRCLILSNKGVVIGQHGWFGQHCILDGTGGLFVGNGVRVGMYSQIWSHVAAGEQIEGCTLYGDEPVVIEDDVWLVGSCIVAKGLTIGRRTIALIASNITKSCLPEIVIAGSPAQQKEKLDFYKKITLEEKWALLSSWLLDAADVLNFSIKSTPCMIICTASSNESIIFCIKSQEVQSTIGLYPDATVCCVETKFYHKRLTKLEHQVLKYLAGNKARFIAY
jgi:acetyltransferase-like isoleucine patch superfamily enzyme